MCEVLGVFAARDLDFELFYFACAQGAGLLKPGLVTI